MNRNNLIKIYHRYRLFICTFLLIGVAGFLSDIKPLYNQFQEVLQQKKNISSQLEEKEKTTQQISLMANRLNHLDKNNTPLLEQIIQAAAWNHCDIHGLQIEPSSGVLLPQKLDNTFILKMNLQGGYIDFYHFLEMLLQQKLPLTLNQFSLKMMNTVLDIDIQFSVYPLAFWMSDTVSLDVDKDRRNNCKRDPFQDTPDFTKNILSADSIQEVSIEKMRYVGYLAQKEKNSGFIFLPDGSVHAVSLGTLVGKEKWMVAKINTSSLMLTDLQRKKYKWIPIQKE